MACLKRQQEFPLQDIGTNRIKGFCNTLQTKLFDKESSFGREYLKVLIEEIRIDGKEVRMSGSYARNAVMGRSLDANSVLNNLHDPHRDREQDHWISSNRGIPTATYPDILKRIDGNFGGHCLGIYKPGNDS
jgi:hypothetical protein